MKKFKNILLAVVLAFAFCLPVFGLAGCDWNETTTTKSGLGTFATDVVKAGNGYLKSLVKQHTALVKKYELDQEHDDPWEPTWEGNDQQVYEALAGKIEHYWDDNAFGYVLDEAMMLCVSKPGTLYSVGDSYAKVEETDQGFVSTMTYSEQDFKSYQEMKAVYEGNKLVRIEMMGTELAYSQDWEVWGVNRYYKEVLDLKTNMNYSCDLLAIIPEKETSTEPGAGEGAYANPSKEYWNGLEIFLDAYNSGNFSNDLLGKVYDGDVLDLGESNFVIEKLDAVEFEDEYRNIYSILRAIKNVGVTLEYVAAEGVPEYGIFDGVNLPDITDEIYEEIDSQLDYYIDYNGIFIKESELVPSYDQMVSALTQIVKIARDYEKWTDEMPAEPLNIREGTEYQGSFDYDDFPYQINIKLDTERVDYIETMLYYIKHTNKEDWEGELAIYYFDVNQRSSQFPTSQYPDPSLIYVRQELTEIDVDGNHSYWFTEENAEFGEGSGQWVFGFTLDATGKVTALEFWNDEAQE